MRPHSPKISNEVDVNCEPCISSSAYMVDHEAWKIEPLRLVRAKTPKSCSSADELLESVHELYPEGNICPVEFMMPEENHMEDSILSTPRSHRPMELPQPREDPSQLIEDARQAMVEQKYEEAYLTLKDALVSFDRAKTSIKSYFFFVQTIDADNEEAQRLFNESIIHVKETIQNHINKALSNIQDGLANSAAQENAKDFKSKTEKIKEAVQSIAFARQQTMMFGSGEEEK